MIDSLLNVLFRCSHHRLTRPVSPVTRAGVPHGETYVVCLDCGKRFVYDLKQMRIGRQIEDASGARIVPAPKRKSKLRYALWASLPAAVLLGSFLKRKQKAAPAAETKPEPHPEHAHPK